MPNSHSLSTHSRALPSRVYSAETVKLGEREAASHAGIALYTLMQRAGDSAFELLKSRYPKLTHILVCCGKGNNGGDGYIVAAKALQENIAVTLWQIGDPNLLTGDALKAKCAFLQSGGNIHAPGNQISDDVDVIVDALLGTGLKDAPRPYYSHIIDRINQSQAPVIAIDIPSGVNANTGNVTNNAVEASHTITFIGVKSGLVTGNARQYVGELVFAGLEVNQYFDTVTQAVGQLTDRHWLSYLRPRRQDAHKGSNGKLLVVGGDEGMSGAAYFSSAAALRVGTGLVATLSHPKSVDVIRARLPEAMVVSTVVTKPQCSAATCTETAFGDDVTGRLEWASVACIGVGLGRNDWSKAVFELAERFFCDRHVPRVLDADALYWLADRPHNGDTSPRILTPHPGEAARLLGVSIDTVEKDRYTASRQLVEQYGGVVVLKGAGTLITNGDKMVICHAGNPGMATGGMGDVLSGVIAGLLAQNYPIFDAAVLGTLIHSLAGDESANECGAIGMLASDLLPYLRKAVNATHD
ncbi:NAD(P)H-hydrate dehydratase [Vibrio methylphosphonaticus]|uniref:NAD(P)H-hydrate dehydratase n=1 Tax=Vibrio methylphosphonaticus TaxID=2946866 RepID=UPI002029F2E9|nr:NAD(P)H-hydrate dehydratase [Vibrio methylphosphonaticus]MCL9773949.1 NAD(P)H-hydrate dehydratase [Vibrio methylphosphonaticus]